MQQNLNLTTTSDWARAIANIVLALFQPFAPFTLQTNGVNDIATRSAQSTSLFTPPDFTFAIWGLIFLGMIAYGVYQILPKSLSNIRLRKIGWWTAAAMALNVAWMLQVILFGLNTASLLIILAMLAALLFAYFSLYKGKLPVLAEKVFVIFPVSIFAAWITVASIAGIPIWFFNTAGFSLGQLADGVWVALLAIIAGLIASGIMRQNRGNIYYACVVVWALAGIAFKCFGLGEILAMSGALVAAVIVISALVIISKTDNAINGIRHD